MKLLIGLLAMLLPIFSAAQSPPVRALSVGDTVPDIVIRNVYNYPDSVIKLSDLKGKLTILDFWATWCGSCLSAFPEMHDLKKTFGNDLDILFINSYDEDKTKVEATFSRLKQKFGTVVSLPYALRDSSLKQHFPHRYIPHYIWLDKDRKVLAITARQEVNNKNIRQFLNAEIPTMAVKDDQLLFNKDVPLLVDGNGGDPGSFIFRSILTGYKAGLGHAGGKEIDKNERVKRFYSINITPLNLLREAYPIMRNWKISRILFETADSAKFRDFPDAEKEHLYCYELICPPVMESQIKTYMQNDLAKFFNVEVVMQEKKSNCYILTVTDNIKKVISRDDSSYSEVASGYLQKKFRGQTVGYFASILENVLKVPVIDETNEYRKIDIDFPADFLNYDPSRIIHFLRQNGFHLAPSTRQINVLVVRENLNSAPRTPSKIF